MSQPNDVYGSSFQGPGGDAACAKAAGLQVVNGFNKTESIIPTTNGSVKPEESSYDEVINQFRGAMIDELSTLKAEIEVLKKGGWKVQLGSFQPTITQNEADLQVFRQDIENRVRSKIAANAPKLLKVDHNVVARVAKPASNGIANGNPSNALTSAVPEPWKPAYIRELKPLDLPFPPSPTLTTFSWSFLTKIFHGAIEWSPGLYYMPKIAGGSILPDRTFYAIQAENEPFIPTKPAEHGAKLTAFFNPNDPADGTQISYEDVPLFIALPNNNGRYTYMGTYSQSRWSDKVSYDTIATHIPQHVKNFWAAQLADPTRPDWVTKCLMKQFFPMPEYEGPFPKSTPNGSVATAHQDEDVKNVRRVKRAVNDFVEELRLWEKDARTQVGLMSKEVMEKAFDNSDADTNPGLRFWWEYLECKKWDREFYDMLVKEQSKAGAGV